MIKLSLIIATYNRKAQLLVSLNSLLGQTAPAESWECIVINNNSSDDTLSEVENFIARHPEINIKVFTETRQGLSHARNRGIEESRGEYIAIIDDDEYVNADFISSYIDFFDSHSECKAAGGRVIPEYPSKVKPRQLSRKIEQALANPIDLGSEKTTFPKGKIPAGGNMAFRRKILLEYGCFNTALGRNGQQLTGGEESHLFERMRADGVLFHYVHNAVIWHVIPPEKLTEDYLKRLARGIGKSQYQRALLRGDIGKFRFVEAMKNIVAKVYSLLLCGSEKRRWLRIFQKNRYAAIKEQLKSK